MKNLIIALALLCAVGNAAVAQSRNERNQAKRQARYDKQPAPKTHELPCMMYDDADYYCASGASRIKMGGDNGGLSTNAINKLLGDCQQQLKMKIKGRYQAVVHDYFDQMDMDGKSTASSHIESAGEMIIDQFLEDTEIACQELDNKVDDAGYSMLYMGIQVRKTDVADAIVEGMKTAPGLSEQEKDLVRNNESKLREATLDQFGKDKKKDSNITVSHEE